MWEHTWRNFLQQQRTLGEVEVNKLVVRLELKLGLATMDEIINR